MAKAKSGHDPLAALTSRQRHGLAEILREVSQAKSWSWSLPVLLHERSWLRLMQIRLNQLYRYLPPDGREDAPELVRFRTLIEEGFDALQAQQHCWEEFGMEDCQRALRRFWDGQSQNCHGWTLRRYLALVTRYRRSIDAGAIAVPLLVLAQQGSDDFHQLHWVTDSTPTMRHTCA